MKKIVFLLAITIFSCSPSPSNNKASEFENVLESYYQESLSLYKLKATYQGDTRYNDTLPNYLSDGFKIKAKALDKQNAVCSKCGTQCTSTIQLRKHINRTKCIKLQLKKN